MGSGESYKLWIINSTTPKRFRARGKKKIIKKKKKGEKKNFYGVCFVFLSWQTRSLTSKPNRRAYAGCCGHGDSVINFLPPVSYLPLKEPKLHGEHADHSEAASWNGPAHAD